MLINADFLQNFRLGKVNPEKQNASKTTFIQKSKTAIKVYANPGLCWSAFEQPGPDVVEASYWFLFLFDIGKKSKE